jgi:MtN3 and saliva related transmembrane protein
MSLVTNVRYLAALPSMASFAPQAWKIIRSRETKDISAGMYLLTVSAFALWLAYGILQKQWPLVVSNSVRLVLSAFILVMTILPRSERHKVAKTLARDKR